MERECRTQWTLPHSMQRLYPKKACRHLKHQELRRSWQVQTDECILIIAEVIGKTLMLKPELHGVKRNLGLHPILPLTLWIGREIYCKY